MGATGTSVIDFGTNPGANEATVTVPSAEVGAASKVEAFFMSTDSSADHTANDHAYVPLFCALTCSQIIPGVSFTIQGVCRDKLVGKWNINWVWAD